MRIQARIEKTLSFFIQVCAFLARFEANAITSRPFSDRSVSEAKPFFNFIIREILAGKFLQEFFRRAIELLFDLVLETPSVLVRHVCSFFIVIVHLENSSAPNLKILLRMVRFKLHQNVTYIYFFWKGVKKIEIFK